MITIAPPASPRTTTQVPGVEVTGGVDTHADTHTAAAIDAAGHRLGHRQFPANAAGYRELLAWLRSFGVLVRVGVEGTGAYGAGLAGCLSGEGVVMIEVDRPDRKTRRSAGKSDPIDAEAAARAALARTQTGTPKDRSGAVEALRNLRVARRSAVQHRSSCQRQIKSLIVTAVESLRAQLRDLTDAKLIETCAGLRPDVSRIEDPEQAAKTALRFLARRHRTFSTEIDELDVMITSLVTQISPDLLTHTGVGPDSAGQLLVTAGQNAERLHSEAAFAMLCGAGPIPASSGKTQRHRLNRGGDRQANAALYRVIICRMRWDARTRAYVERRTQQGRSKKEIIRCLKRMLARELYPHLRPTQPAKPPANAT